MTEYEHERELLRCLFPRGRFARHEDGACVLRARLKARAQDEVYVFAPGSKLGIFYVGNGAAYRNRLGDLIVDELPCDGEGLLFVKWTAEVAERLPWFSRKKWNGAGIAGSEENRPEKGTSSASDEAARPMVRVGQEEGSQP